GPEKEAPENRDPGIKKKSRIKWILAVLVAALAAAGGARVYHYNLPGERAKRILAQADEQMQALQIEDALALYEEVLALDPENQEAGEGKLTAMKAGADALADAGETSSYVEACKEYREILSLFGGDPLLTDEKNGMEQEIRDKVEALEQKIAASCETVSCVTTPYDRSGKAVRKDGTEIAYTWYYDLVEIDDPLYPYAERINSVLRQDMDDFFAAGGSDPSAAAVRLTSTGSFRHYVGEGGICSRDGILSIRTAEVRQQGQVVSNKYRGRTFRLSDGRELSLQDLAERTDSGLRRLVRRRLWNWLEQQGYRDISKADVEEYVEDTDPDAFRFFVREDGEILLVIDQEVPFFSNAQEILEIPLQLQIAGETGKK
ncbi:MAG: hypothetical protein Q4D81_05095, partial [Eubacteriales bacterium]|nr:hypothetical protein [Eubacteriales bacterium]